MMKHIILFVFITHSALVLGQATWSIQDQKPTHSLDLLGRKARPAATQAAIQSISQPEQCEENRFIPKDMEKIGGLGCLDNRKQTSFSQIALDRKVCSCFENESSLITFSYKNISLMEGRGKLINPEMIRKKHIDKEWKKVEGMRIAETVDATLIFNEKPELARFFIKDGKDSLAAFEKYAKSNVFKTYGAEIFNDEIPSGNFCISPREYMAYKQLPRDPELTKLFQTESFAQEDWDFEQLKKKYTDLGEEIGREYRGAKSEEKLSSLDAERKSLLVKLKFLNRNSFIKNMFQQNEKPAAKLELMKILKSYKDNGKNGFDQVYAKSLKEFFANNNDIVKNNSDQKWKEATKNLKKDKKDLISEIRVLNRKEILESISQNYGFNHNVDNTCTLMSLEFGGEKALEDCLLSYSVLCSTLNKLEEKKIAVFADEGSVDIDDILNEDLSIVDMHNSKDYRDANTKMCQVATQDGKEVSYSNFAQEHCGPKPDLLLCREKFIEAHRENLHPEFLGLAGYFKKNPLSKIDEEKAKVLASGKSVKSNDKNMMNEFDDYRSNTLTGNGSSSRVVSSSDRDDERTTFNSLSNSMVEAPTNNQEVYYPTTFAESSNSESAKSSKTIDDYSKAEQESLLESWKREMETLRNTPVTSAEGASKKLASEKLLQERISAIETLILQQKELNDRQYALLNESLKAKEKELENKIAELESDEGKKAQAKRVRESEPDFEENSFMRTPASVMKAPTAYQSGAGAGETGGIRAGSGSVASGQSSAQAMKEAANREALAREEAKLVNLRQEASGAIVLEGAKTNGGNAIALSISDEFYRQARGNLASINLLQIEKNIPKDQIDLLEKQGVITLILQNGNNPPLEVKVTRKQGRLVQLDNAPAVVRKVSLQGLQNTLRE